MRLISFLGTGKYEETSYTLNGQNCKTKYVAAALMQLLKADELTVLATKEARTTHEASLQQELSRLGLVKAEIKDIPSGSNEQELWQQFEVIREATIEKSPKSITFDITLGFRAPPFFAAAIINYLRNTQTEMPEMHVVYGEFRKDETNSPIWDLSAFISLLDWSSALQNFLKTGHGGRLADLVKQENALLQKHPSGGRRPTRLSALVSTLKEFSENIATVRCSKIITGDERSEGSARKVLKKIEESRDEVKEYFKPLAPILDSLSERLKDLPSDSLFGQAGHDAMSALAKLYLDYERYPEAAIVVREGWISLYDANVHLSDDQRLAQDKRTNTEKCWRDQEGVGAKKGTGADTLSNVRNDIEHGGFNEQPKPAKTLIEEIKKCANVFDNKKLG
ncbi:TM1812 family CRISPR-associated protein [Thioflexithrix psekupsensis]|uniref:CRISPR-associated protein n=1 Tax=Thioflexithrix psekupsensis TaxID=1570016 RepID=A0A251XA25_9GAMM|nr:TM1812 family CRISPR-associated protein [Thioflexithrix psekupsensis]OUD14533.1 hypothetical protein TPSD3_09580 [Thioflexithrix psekupsensis]